MGAGASMSGRHGSPAHASINVVRLGSFADRIFDLDLCLIHARFRLSGASCSYDPLNTSELPCAPRDVRDGHVAKLARSGAARKYSATGKELVAIFEDIHIVGGSGAIVVNVIGNAARPLFLHLHSVDDGGVGRKGAINFKGPHLMPGNVSDVEKLLLRVFGIFSAHLVGNSLRLLGERIAGWYGNCETQQNHGCQNECDTSIHDPPPLC